MSRAQSKGSKTRSIRGGILSNGAGDTRSKFNGSLANQSISSSAYGTNLSTKLGMTANKHHKQADHSNLEHLQ